MRLELGGSIPERKPVVLIFHANDTFNAAAYKALGYRFFDVICIAGGGGRGGNTYGQDTLHAGEYVRTFGGAGGGGGYQRLRGLLDLVPSTVAIVVGAAGADGTDSISAPTWSTSLTTDGGNGGDSSFWTPACHPTGGQGGKRSMSRSRGVSSSADGGAGGYKLTADTANQGIAGVFEPSGPNTPPSQGLWGNLYESSFTHGRATAFWEGEGGGGGPGGIESVTPGTPPTGGIVRMRGEAGGRGSFSPAYESIYGPASPAQDDLDTGASGVIPGNAGGARITIFNGSSILYGGSGKAGVVAVRLY
jgi:hypothetical protein